MGGQLRGLELLMPNLKTKRKKAKAIRNSAATTAAILNAAKKEFAFGGYSGASIGKISRRAGTNERMIYYYYKSKEGLYIAVLEQAYAEMVDAENALDLDQMDPREAIRELISVIWKYYREHPEFIALVGSENLERAIHIKKSLKLKTIASPQLRILEKLLSRGSSMGIFRTDIDAHRLFLTIAALGWFYFSNMHTLSNYLQKDLAREPALHEWLQHIIAVVLASLAPTQSKL